MFGHQDRDRIGLCLDQVDEEKIFALGREKVASISWSLGDPSRKLGCGWLVAGYGGCEDSSGE
jgi:hypothetical protein